MAVDSDFRTPLHWAAVLGLSQIVGILMENGADPTALDATGATPLRYAVSLYYLKIPIIDVLVFYHTRQ